jgi:hypothetical protein
MLEWGLRPSILPGDTTPNHFSQHHGSWLIHSAVGDLEGHPDGACFYTAVLDTHWWEWYSSEA